MEQSAQGHTGAGYGLQCTRSHWSRVQAGVHKVALEQGPVREETGEHWRHTGAGRSLEYTRMTRGTDDTGGHQQY